MSYAFFRFLYPEFSRQTGDLKWSNLADTSLCVCVCLFPGYRRSLDNSSLGDWQVWWPMPVIHRLLCQVLRLLACKLCASALLFLEKRRLLSSQKINLQPEILCSHVVSSLYKGSSDDSTLLIIFSYAHWTSCTVRCNPILSDRITIKKVQFVWNWMFESRQQFVKYWHFPVSPTRQILSQTDLQSESLNSRRVGNEAQKSTGPNPA